MKRKLLARLLRLPLRRGFSLVEIIFAASLLSLVMLMMFNLYPTSLLTIRQAEHRLEANSLAQAVLETFKATAFPSACVPSSTLNPLSTASPSALPSYGEDGCSYWTEVTASYSPSPTSTATSPRLVDMKVTCYWNEQSDSQFGTSGPNYWEKWHHLTQELYICDIQR